MAKQTELAKRGGMGRPGPDASSNDGNPTTPLKELSPEIEEPKLVNTVEERLSHLGDMTRPRRGEADPDELEEEELDEEEEENLYEEDEEEESSEPKEEDEGTPTPPKEDEGIKGMPSVYIQAAKAMDWTDEDIASFVAQDRDKAMKTFEKLYESRNKVNAHYSALGRQAAKSQENKTQDNATPKKLKPLDREVLTEQFGEEASPLIDMLVQQQDAINSLVTNNQTQPDNSHLLPDVDRRMSNAVEESGVEQQVHVFFGMDDMKPFNKMYGELQIGETIDDLPAGQRQNRFAVMQKADLIARGAFSQGIQMSLPEALASAHLLVAQKHRDQILVDGIKKKVVKRSKGRTLKPSKGIQTNKPELGDKPKGKRSAADLESAVASKLRKTFKS